MFDYNKLEQYFDSIKSLNAKSIKFSNTKIGIESPNTMYVTFYKIDGNINLKSNDLNKLKEAVALFLL